MEVATTQMKILSTKVDKGFAAIVFSCELDDPKQQLKCDVNALSGLAAQVAGRLQGVCKRETG